MSLNGAAPVERSMRFCETGDALAIRFVAASRDRAALPDALRQMQDSFAELIAHLSECHECDARNFLQEIAERRVSDAERRVASYLRNPA